MRAFIALLILINSGFVGAQSCEPEVTINLSFRYEAPYELPATAKDMKLYEKLASGGRVVNLYLDKSASKEDILKRIKNAIGEAKNVRFNYSGHGIVTKRDGTVETVNDLYQESKKYSSAPVETKKVATKPGQYVPPYGAVDDSVYKLEENKPSSIPKGGQFALSPPGCQACIAEAKKSCHKRMKGEASYKGLNDEQAEHFGGLMEWTCYNQPDQPERQDCYRKACITTEDMSQLFANRSVSGFMDACHSGFIEGLEVANFNFVTSASTAKAPGGDAKSGGALSSILNSKNLCELDIDGDGQISNTEMIGIHGLKSKLSSVHEGADPHVVRSREVGGGCFIRPKNCGGRKQQPNPNGGGPPASVATK